MTLTSKRRISYALTLAFLLSLLVFLPGCNTIKEYTPFMDSDSDEVTEAPDDPPAEELYAKGKNSMDEGYYKDAIKYFEEIERLYPFSRLATRAKVMVAYAYYKDEEFDDAVTVIDRFQQLHPGNKDVAYMYYLKGLSYYDRIADIKRDQGVTDKALDALREVVRRYPESDYGRDAKLKIDLVQDHLAGKEMEIGRFYLKQRKYVAAINRFQTVVKDYERTSQVMEALYRLVESYLSLGLLDEAKKNAAVLGHNYPESKWYKYAYRLIEEGENSPVPLKSRNWFNDLLEFDSPSTGELPRNNEADSWMDQISDWF